MLFSFSLKNIFSPFKNTRKGLPRKSKKRRRWPASGSGGCVCSTAEQTSSSFVGSHSWMEEPWARFPLSSQNKWTFELSQATLSGQAWWGGEVEEDGITTAFRQSALCHVTPCVLLLYFFILSDHIVISDPQEHPGLNRSASILGFLSITGPSAPGSKGQRRSFSPLKLHSCPSRGR